MQQQQTTHKTRTFSAPAMASEGTLRSAFTQQTLPVPSLSSRLCLSTISVYALAGEVQTRGGRGGYICTMATFGRVYLHSFRIWSERVLFIWPVTYCRCYVVD